MKRHRLPSSFRSIVLVFISSLCALSSLASPATTLADTVKQSTSPNKPMKLRLGTGSLEKVHLGIGWQLTTHQEFLLNGALHFNRHSQTRFLIASAEHRWHFGTQLPNAQRRFYWSNRIGLALPFDETYGVSTAVGVNLGRHPKHGCSFDIGLVGVVFGGYEPFGFAFPAFRFQKHFQIRG